MITEQDENMEDCFKSTKQTAKFGQLVEKEISNTRPSENSRKNQSWYDKHAGKHEDEIIGSDDHHGPFFLSKPKPK